MSDLIETRYEMLRAGYKFLSKARCRNCNSPIEWWQTTRGKKLPYNPLPADDQLRAIPHWATCPKSNDVRGGSRVMDQVASLRLTLRTVQAMAQSAKPSNERNVLENICTVIDVELAQPLEELRIRQMPDGRSKQ